MAFTLTNHLTADAAGAALADDVRSGLGSSPKVLPPRWFYDAVGSDLFDQITRLPEYYLTRAETRILRCESATIVAAAGADTLVEIGSGTSEKTRILLDAMQEQGRLHRFVPFDVDSGALEAAAARLLSDYPGLAIDAVCGDFEKHLAGIPTGGRRLFIFLGSTIGNLTTVPRAVFLAELAAIMCPGDHLLLGTDLVKDPIRLIRAYDDSAGVTARFNMNVLAVLNRELGADFDIGSFAHVARWNSGEERIEMWLRATSAQRVRIPAVDMVFDFGKGEQMLTEVSCKFRPDRVAGELATAGLRNTRCWTDPAGEFALSLAVR